MKTFVGWVATIRYAYPTATAIRLSHEYLQLVKGINASEQVHAVFRTDQLSKQYI
jgi:hypothetical protein